MKCYSSKPAASAAAKPAKKSPAETKSEKKRGGGANPRESGSGNESDSDSSNLLFLASATKAFNGPVIGTVVVTFSKKSQALGHPSGLLPLCQFCPSKVSSLPFLLTTKRLLSVVKAELSLPAVFMLGPLLHSLGFSNSKCSMQSKALKIPSSSLTKKTSPPIANTLPWKTA